MKLTQKQRIIQYIEQFGSITPMEAYGDLGITKLATRISEMRKGGMEFKIEMEQGKNRFQEPVRYARYSFPDGDNEKVS